MWRTPQQSCHLRDALSPCADRPSQGSPRRLEKTPHPDRRSPSRAWQDSSAASLRPRRSSTWLLYIRKQQSIKRQRTHYPATAAKVARHGLQRQGRGAFVKEDNDHRHQRPSLQSTEDRPCTKNQNGPVRSGCSFDSATHISNVKRPFVNNDMIEFLACPENGEALVEAEDGLARSNGTKYPVRFGVPILVPGVQVEQNDYAISDAFLDDMIAIAENPARAENRDELADAFRCHVNFADVWLNSEASMFVNRLNGQSDQVRPPYKRDESVPVEPEKPHRSGKVEMTPLVAPKAARRLATHAQHVHSQRHGPHSSRHGKGCGQSPCFDPDRTGQQAGEISAVRAEPIVTRTA